MKTLIAFYSWTGNNHALAETLQKKLSCDVYEIVELKKRNALGIILDLLFKRVPKIEDTNLDVKSYDHVILCAPIWSGKIASPLKAFILKQLSNIKTYSFITICTGRSGQKDWLHKELTKLFKRQPASVTELMVNDLLPAEKRDKIKHTTSYRINEWDLKAFEDKIDAFVKNVQREGQPLSV